MQYDQCLTKGPDGSKVMITHCNLNEFKEWQYFKVFCILVLKYMLFHFNNTYHMELRHVNRNTCFLTGLHFPLIFLITGESPFDNRAPLLFSSTVSSRLGTTQGPCRPTAHLSIHTGKPVFPEAIITIVLISKSDLFNLNDNIYNFNEWLIYIYICIYSFNEWLV